MGRGSSKAGTRTGMTQPVQANENELSRFNTANLVASYPTDVSVGDHIDYRTVNAETGNTVRQRWNFTRGEGEDAIRFSDIPYDDIIVESVSVRGRSTRITGRTEMRGTHVERVFRNDEILRVRHR